VSQNRSISELGLRVATAAVLIPIVLWVTVLGGWWFQILVLFLAVLLARELVDNVVVKRGGVFGLLTAALFLGSGLLSIYGYVLIGLSLGLIGAVVLVASVGLRGARAVIFAGGIIFGNSAVVGLIALRSGPEFGLIAVFWLFGVVWSADTLAYFSGRLIGGPKLAPAISPNKTWAGFIGGIIGAALAGFVVTRIVDVGSGNTVIALSAVAAIIAQAGDLQESWAKRHLGIKDSGRLLPGHGGIWDRLDALIVVAIFATVIGLIRGNDQSIAYNLMIW
jgi:phosphatidate cytidylyltransferase